MCKQSQYKYFHAEAYASQILKKKPASIQKNNYLNNIYDSIQGESKREQLKIVHVSDPHIDFLYQEGADQMCTNYLCCGADDGFPTEPER